ncbi:myb family transcription factor EFM isoform X2 [Physcomitrium patens]|uniref:HTH myb-type domain-containing protein n=1 Tax=Physcomitrium patens TaxID=3218 RepID=A0A7I4BYA3_PHYPA|nr:transcription factor NIGT1-like isoform X2 [Physcomitrium patens]|eukprot:XP_024357510.1 transcription factor NIGT1-like isoform X2 [Physcomitrella patens]
MGSPANLALGPQVSTITSTIETALNCTVSADGLEADEIQKIAAHLRALQEERGKIEAFKRELPLCMQLLDEAIETAINKVMVDQCSPTASLQTSVLDAQDSDYERPKRTLVLENFMPLKRRWEKQLKEKIFQNDAGNNSQQHEDKVVIGRPAWMKETQLWTKQSESIDYEASPSRGSRRQVEFKCSEQDRPLTSSRLLLNSKDRQGGAFVPFNREKQLPSPPFSSQSTGPASDAAGFSTSSAVRTPSRMGHTIESFDIGRVNGNVHVRDHSSDARNSIDHSVQTRTGANQPQRKARRCWSPELHRRFVSALQQLGGSQVATPKQIRELMKVDGLTNDEVKSHLQKYRLHTRRPSPSPPSPSHAPQLVVVGWVRPEFTAVEGAASQASTGDNPLPGISNECVPSQSTGQPQKQSPPNFQKHLPAVSTSQTSLRGPSPVGVDSPHSSSDSYIDESDDEQDGNCTSSGENGRQYECNEKPLQSARESKGSTTCLADIDATINPQMKLRILRKTKAAA